MTRFLSLWLPHLATDRWRRRRPAAGAKAPEAPRATVAKVKSAQRLVALDARAEALGLSPGLTLADARARYPALVTFEADPAAEAATLADVADWCCRFTPLAALDPPDGVMLDVAGAAHLFGGEPKLLAEIEARLAAQGFDSRVALAPTPEAAWALARFGSRRLMPPDIEEKIFRRCMSELPLAALRLEAKTVAALAQAGLRRVGDILMRPRAPVAARFGVEIFIRLDAMLGQGKSPISPRFEAPAYLAERRFAEGIARIEDVEAVILALAQDLSGLLTQHGEGARILDVSLFRVDGVVKHLTAGTSRPVRDPQAIARLFRERIASAGEAGLDTGYGFDVVRLAALQVERQDQTQAHWDATAGDDLPDLIDRLGARLGLRRVVQMRDTDTHVPEFAVLAVPAAAARMTRPLLFAPPPQREARARSQKPPGALPSRPIRLLNRPEPIETLATVPDGPPARFRWRRVLHEVAAIEGPERIAPEWWREPDALTRDYFRVEDTQGQRFWLFREGLFVRETQQPRWFVHGLFA